MSLRLGDLAPDFQVETTEGKISFHEWMGEDWCILFSHPKDFTPVCTTELGLVAHLVPEFNKRKTKVIGLSVDSVEEHREWIKDIEETQNCKVNYPLIADANREIAQKYDMIHPNASDSLTVRSVFIIDPKKKVRLTITYPASTGRNFDEILRALDSLQLTDQFQVATPGNWQRGQDCIIVPAVSDEEIPGKFPKGHKTVKPYLRTTPQPNL